MGLLEALSERVGANAYRQASGELKEPPILAADEVFMPCIATSPYDRAVTQSYSNLGVMFWLLGRPH